MPWAGASPSSRLLARQGPGHPHQGCGISYWGSQDPSAPGTSPSRDVGPVAAPASWAEPLQQGSGGKLHGGWGGWGVGVGVAKTGPAQSQQG